MQTRGICKEGEEKLEDERLRFEPEACVAVTSLLAHMQCESPTRIAIISIHPEIFFCARRWRQSVNLKH